MTSTPPAILVDARDPVARTAWSWGHEAPIHLVEGDPSTLHDALESCEQGGTKVVGVQGGDAFLGRVMTALRRRTSSLELFPLPVHPQESEVARSLGAGDALKERARALIKGSKKDRFKRTSIQPLWFSCSAEDGGRYVFNVAAGWFYELWLATRRGGVLGALQLASMGVEVAKSMRAQDAARALKQGVGKEGALMRDRERVEGLPFGLLCGALDRGRFGIALSKEGGARSLSVSNESDALALIARARAPLARLRGEAGEPFDTLHLDGIERLMIDGQDAVFERACMIQMRPGESFTLLH